MSHIINMYRSTIRRDDYNYEGTYCTENGSETTDEDGFDYVKDCNSVI